MKVKKLFSGGLLVAILFSIASFLESYNLNSKEKPKADHLLWYLQPAKDWFEALPLGNGRLGAMVYGDPETEHLQLNEESIWGGAPEDPIPKNAKEHYQRFQQLNLEGQYDKALEYAMENLAISPTSIRSYQPFGDLSISFDEHDRVKNYKRQLNLQNGICTISYEINGKRFIRESFISAKYNTLFYHFKSVDGALVKSEIGFDRERDIKKHIEGNSLIIDGQIIDDPHGYDDNPGGSGKGGEHINFDGIIRVVPQSGKVNPKEEALEVENTDEFTIIVSSATDYNLNLMSFDRGIDPLSVCKSQIKRASSVEYKDVKADHISSHSSMMNRLKLDISFLEKDSIPTDIRLEKLKKGKEDNYLTELLFQYGRYLLLSSSGGNSVLPANLQGIWNKDMWAPWESDFHLNINLQMNYWPADVCNLSETVDPLSSFMKKLSEKGKLTASHFLDTEGWMAHHVSNPFGRSTASGSTKSSQVNNGYCFPLAGAWMSLTLWRHYEFTGDKEYLRETAYPVLSGAARFILDFLQINDKGELVTAPSYSPENEYIDPVTGKKIRNTIAASIDIQIIRDVFKACLISEELLGYHTKLRSTIEEAVKKLPKIKIGRDGTIQEWYEDVTEVEVGHRHVSHLYALYPSDQINPSLPELYTAAEKTLHKRLSGGGGQTGWSRAWMINFYARLFNGDQCNEHIKQLLIQLVSPNLLNLHPPHIFQIDGNFGAISGMAEMLVQSHNEEIILLPALPSSWKDGQLTGICARGGFELDMTWKEGKLLRAVLHSKLGNRARIKYRNKIIDLETVKGERYKLDI